MDKAIRNLISLTENSAKLTRTVFERLQLMQSDFTDIVRQYDIFAEHLIKLSDADGDELLGIKARIARLRQMRHDAELVYSRENVLAKPADSRSAAVIFVTALLVGLAALVSVYTAGYVRGENAARGRDVLVASEQGGSISSDAVSHRVYGGEEKAAVLSDATGTSRPQWEVAR